ncbi:DeoR/GlpR family DNA-binding transcription regulator [Rhizobium tumorigenes]|uniref:DeoR/GlpR family DNA-binding transcription regulator n=1 Tax=Rhizobium tumorigenes TaxID=2041385 RepID=A0AAF1KTD9_9HYPH|nr:DeoR/GlpR family DNA-binding transcription regulator [Rhizobium tumorigenes]WFR99117.1 DeoR/GlpR family DNA-binding transcription regulator [Rhizobium tumorigenes]
MADHDDTDETPENPLMQEQVPSDTRLARQLARRQQMTETVMAEGSVRIEDLAERFGISLMTAHRDLDELVSRGILRKTRGIASAAPTSLIESSDVYRSSRQSVEKRALALAAMRFVEPGQAIFFDDSTTVLQMAQFLPSAVPLTVITNSLTLMNDLKGIRDLTLLGLGGQYYNWCNAFMGRMTTHEISQLRADTLFMSMSAITDDIVFHQFLEMVDTKRAMFDSASTRILLADNTKFDRRALHVFSPLTDFDIVIVDDGTPPVHIARMRDKGINVVVAPTRGSSHASALKRYDPQAR